MNLIYGIECIIVNITKGCCRLISLENEHSVFFFYVRINLSLLNSSTHSLSFHFCNQINIAAKASAAASGAIEEDKSADIVDESNEVRCKKYYYLHIFYTSNVCSVIIMMFAIQSHPPNETLY